MAAIAIPQASLFLGIVPALILLYIGLKNYDEYYKEKTIFVTFVAGIIAGVIAAAIELVTLSIGILFILLFPLLEQLLKTMVLNLRRFQGKPAVPIYGLSIGLGFGSVFTPVTLIMVTTAEGIELYTFGFVLLGSIGIIFAHAATGIIIGYGVYMEQLWNYFLFALIVHIPVPLLVFLTEYFSQQYIMGIAIVYGGVLFWYALKRVLPRILRDNQPRKRSNIAKKTTE